MKNPAINEDGMLMALQWAIGDFPADLREFIVEETVEGTTAITCGGNPKTACTLTLHYEDEPEPVVVLVGIDGLEEGFDAHKLSVGGLATILTELICEGLWQSGHIDRDGEEYVRTDGRKLEIGMQP